MREVIPVLVRRAVLACALCVSVVVGAEEKEIRTLRGVVETGGVLSCLR